MDNPIIENILKAGWETELGKLSTALDTLIGKVEKINVNIGKGGTSSDAGYKQLTKAVNELTEQQRLAVAITKELSDQKSKEIALAAQVATATTAEAKAIASLSYTKQELNRITKLEMQMNASVSGSYDALSAQYSLNTITLNKLSQAQIAADPSLVKLQQDTLGLREAMKQAKLATGDTALNVGNYKSALDGATMSTTRVGKGMNNAYNSTFQMTQVMRELPNFAIDARIGLMSLSNNLPMLTDGFKQLANQVDNTTGKAKGWGYAFKTMGMSLISLNTAMIVGMTLMLQYSQEIKDFLSNTDAVTKAHREFVKSIKEGNNEYTTAVKKFDEMTAIMSLAERGIISQKDAIDEYNEKFGKTNGYVKTFVEVQEKMAGNATVYATAMWMMAEANAYLETSIKKAGEAEVLRKAISDPVTFAQRAGYSLKRTGQLIVDYFSNAGLHGKIYVDYFKDLYHDVDNIRESRAKKYQKTSADEKLTLEEFMKKYTAAAEYMKKNGIDIWGGDTKDKKEKTISKEAEAYNMLALQMETYIEKAKELATSDEISFKERQQAVISWFNLRYSVAEEDERVQFALLKKEYEEAKKNTKDRKKLDEWYAQEKEKIVQTSANEYVSIMDESEKMISAINKDETKSEEEKAKEIREIRKDTYDLRLTTLYDAQAMINSVNADEVLSEQQKADLILKIRKKLADDTEKIEEEQRQARYEIARQAVDLIQTIGDGLFERQMDQLEEEADVNQTAYDDRIKAIEALGLSEEETTKEKAAAEAYYQAQKDETDRKEKELKRNQFLFDQAAALAQVAINTAVNITSPSNVLQAMTPYYIAMGIAQAAIIAAQTIPYFAEGGKVLAEGRITDAPNIPQHANGDNILAYVRHGETILNNDQINALGGAWAMKQAGVPGYEDARYIPDMRDIGTQFSGKDKQPIIVNANFESEKIVRELKDIKSALSRKPKLMDELKSKRYGN